MGESQSNFVEVPAARLEPGMYVAQLDRPWLDAPFAVQGFYVRDPADIDFVARHCAYVYVDPRRRQAVKQTPKATRTRRVKYEDKTDLKQELKVARIELESAAGAMQKVFAQLKQNRHLNLPSMQRAIDPLIDSVLRNSDALGALMRMKRRGDYLYNHALSNAVWAAVLGKHIGLDVATLKRLVLGAALVDVGMSQLDERITDSPTALNDQQRCSMREHVLHGIELLREAGGVHNEVIEIVASHHERHDGSGYPRGLAGDKIPLLARIAGLVDTYDAMITDKPWAGGRASFDAIQELADCKDELFQAELVEQFMQAIGLFPTGSLVELNTGEVGVVLNQNPTRRLRPKIVLILNPEKQRCAEMVVIDLNSYARESESHMDLWIKRELKPGDYGIHPDEFFL